MSTVSSAIYVSHLRHLGYGEPLYYPEPSLDDGIVEIGDVGYIQDGAFHRLFNATLPANINQRLGIPKGFIPLQQGNVVKITVPMEPAFGDAISCVSKGVKIVATDNSELPRLSFEEDRKCSVECGVTSSTLHFRCSSEQGSIVVNTSPITLIRATNAAKFEEYTRSHCLSWYAFARKIGRQVDFGKIFIVTNCHRAKSWSSAAYSNCSKPFDLYYCTSHDYFYSPTHRSTTHPSVYFRSSLFCGEQPLPDQTLYVQGFRLGPRTLYLQSVTRKIKSIAVKPKRYSHLPFGLFSPPSSLVTHGGRTDSPYTEGTLFSQEEPFSGRSDMDEGSVDCYTSSLSQIPPRSTSPPAPSSVLRKVQSTYFGKPYEHQHMPISRRHSCPSIRRRVVSDDDYQDHKQIPSGSGRFHAHCVTANAALERAIEAEPDIVNTLASYGYDGFYTIQVGFNESMLHIGQTVEEIYIYLDSSLPCEDAVDAFSHILAPFPGIVYMPKGQRLLLPSSPAEAPETFQDLRHRYTARTHSTTNSDAGSISGSGSEAGGGNNTQADDDDDYGKRSKDDEDDGTSRRNEDNEGGDGGGDDHGGGGGGGRPHGKRTVSIPFESALIIQEYAKDTPSFTISSGVDITINENRSTDSPPPNSVWPGSWFGVGINELNVTADGIYPNASRYTLGHSQVRVCATSEYPTTSVLPNFRPPTTHLEDRVKVKKEKSVAGAASVTLGTSSSLRLGGSYGHATGTEVTPRRWEIIAHPIISHRAHPSQRGMMWKYAHNDRVYEREFAHAFDAPRPTVTFKYDPQLALPHVEVEVVMLWTLSTLKSRTTFPFWKFAKGSMPGFANFFHHVSVELDLEKLNHSKTWVLGTEALDSTQEEEFTADTAAGEKSVFFDPPITVAGLGNDNTVSPCVVSLRRAIHGRVTPLSEDEQKGARPLLLSLNKKDHSGYHPQVLTPLDVTLPTLITPPRTPSPSSSSPRTPLPCTPSSTRGQWLSPASAVRHDSDSDHSSVERQGKIVDIAQYIP